MRTYVFNKAGFDNTMILTQTNNYTTYFLRWILNHPVLYDIWLFLTLFLFPPKKRGKKKRRIFYRLDFKVTFS